MSQNEQFGRLPIIDGPWKGGALETEIGTFEVADDDPLEFANPLTVSPAGVDRVRYYRQYNASGWVWSTTIPDKAGELLQAESKAAAVLLPD